MDVTSFRRPLRVEVKQINVSAANVAYYDGTAGAILVDITAIGQGNTGATRVGDVARLSALRFSYVIYNGIGATANSSTLSRILFFQYIGDSSVAGKPTVADMFNPSNANAGATYGSHSAFDIDFARVYRVLSDHRVLTFGAPAASTSTFIGTFSQRHYTIPLSAAQRDITYFAGATTGPNHIFMCVLSNTATIANNPAIYYNLDVRFTDT